MRHVLVVENSTFIRNIICEMLESINDVTVHTVQTFKALKKILLEQKFDLALVSVNLVDTSPGQAIQYIIRNEVDVMALTSSLDESMRKKLYKQGVKKVIAKDEPTAFANLAQEVKLCFSKGQKNILIVDDSSVARQILMLQLSHDKGEVKHVETGQEALSIIENDPNIALVITDYEMPGMDGLGLVVNIRRRFEARHIGIIALSGTLSEKVKQNFKNAGSTHFLSKPYDIKELEKSIEKLLES